MQNKSNVTCKPLNAGTKDTPSVSGKAIFKTNKH